MESVWKNYQLLKASEGCAPCNEESTIVQLPETNSFSMDRGFAREFLTPIIIVDLKWVATWSDSVWRCLHPWRRGRSRCDGTRSLWWGKLRARSAATAASSRPLSAWSSQNTTCNKRHFWEFWMRWKYHKESRGGAKYKSDSVYVLKKSSQTGRFAWSDKCIQHSVKSTIIGAQLDLLEQLESRIDRPIKGGDLANCFDLPILLPSRPLLAEC